MIWISPSPVREEKIRRDHAEATTLVASLSSHPTPAPIASPSRLPTTGCNHALGARAEDSEIPDVWDEPGFWEDLEARLRLRGPRDGDDALHRAGLLEHSLEAGAAQALPPAQLELRGPVPKRCLRARPPAAREEGAACSSVPCESGIPSVASSGKARAARPAVPHGSVALRRQAARSSVSSYGKVRAARPVVPHGSAALLHDWAAPGSSVPVPGKAKAARPAVPHGSVASLQQRPVSSKSVASSSSDMWRHPTQDRDAGIVSCDAGNAHDPGAWVAMDLYVLPGQKSGLQCGTYVDIEGGHLVDGEEEAANDADSDAEQTSEAVVVGGGAGQIKGKSAVLQIHRAELNRQRIAFELQYVDFLEHLATGDEPSPDVLEKNRAELNRLQNVYEDIHGRARTLRREERRLSTAIERTSTL